MQYIYRITAVIKVGTDIISSITASLIGRAVILVIMYVKIFKTDVIVFIGDVKMCLMSHRAIIFNIIVSSCACELRTNISFLGGEGYLRVSYLPARINYFRLKSLLLQISRRKKTNWNDLSPLDQSQHMCKPPSFWGINQ